MKLLILHLHQKILNDGHVLAKLRHGKIYSIGIDYVLKVTENKALKSSGGIIVWHIRVIHYKGNFFAWIVTAKYIMTFIRAIHMKHANIIDCSRLKHHSDTAASKAKYNEYGFKMVQLR